MAEIPLVRDIKYIDIQDPSLEMIFDRFTPRRCYTYAVEWVDERLGNGRIIEKRFFEARQFLLMGGMVRHEFFILPWR